MVDPATLRALAKYIISLRGHGINPTRLVIFGSHSTGNAHPWSDIDVVVVAPEFDTNRTPEIEDEMWMATTDNRIEPIACGVREWEQENTGRMIVEIARREGVEVPAPA